VAAGNLAALAEGDHLADLAEREPNRLTGAHELEAARTPICS
jgi:hypothetical protein